VGGFEGFRLKLTIALQQNFYFALGFFQFLSAGAGKLHTFIEEFQSTIERYIALFQFRYDFLQPLQTLFKLGQVRTPEQILMQISSREMKISQLFAQGADSRQKFRPPVMILVRPS